MTPLPQECHYSYADLLTWDDNTRYELYDGVPIAFASPSDSHQRVLTALLLQIGNYLEGKPCSVYPAPFDVRLFQSEKDNPKDVDLVVQPDLMVVCDRNKIDRHGVRGAPDLVIEILSDSTRRIDRLVKFNLYQKAGVREYWIVDPDACTIAVHLLQDGQYGSPEFYVRNAFVPVSILDDCTIDSSRIFRT